MKYFAQFIKLPSPLPGTTLITACTVGTSHDAGLHVFMSLALLGLTATTFILVSELETGQANQ